MANYNVSTFKLNPVDAAGTALTGTRALYANGNQQVKLRVTIRKQVDGSNQDLSPSEIDSLEIVSLNGSSPPDKWTSTDKANDYTMGLRSDRSMMKADVIEVEENVKSGDQTFYFYVSTSDTALEPMDFEAIVTIGGTVYRSGSSTYNNSFVTIQAHAPDVFESYELIRNEEDELTFSDYIADNGKDADSYYQVYAVYWNLPDGIKIKTYTLSGSTNSEGLYLTAGSDRYAAAICALPRGKTEFKSHCFGLHGDIGDGIAHKTVVILDYSTSIRASRALVTNERLPDDSWIATAPDTGTSDLTIIDEYGTTSKFTFFATDDTCRNVDIRNAN
ncbi:hypothetical protein HPY09_20710 (plasmid) [Vibrio cholerae]|uniref:hypothetical protein n=1 Tax=Vibrio cholerae TaxID=666 RepID=UPI0015823080|nr:hypothetical protein [Vibrio cholerae]QKU73359.1 hypothetical protein HPY09_20710 [Vibrio cholerae]QKU77349.1 hypothetical protein HPY05_20905 [Vibrio cholerae]